MYFSMYFACISVLNLMLIKIVSFKIYNTMIKYIENVHLSKLCSDIFYI